MVTAYLESRWVVSFCELSLEVEVVDRNNVPGMKDETEKCIYLELQTWISPHCQTTAQHQTAVINAPVLCIIIFW